LGALLFIAGVIAAVFSGWLFFRFGYSSLLLLIPPAVIPLIYAGQAGYLSLYIIPAAVGVTGGYCFRKPEGFDFFLTVSALVFTLLFTAEYHALKSFKSTDIIEKGRDEIVLIMEQGSGDMDRLFDEYKTPEENRKKIKADIETSITLLKESKWVQFARDMLPFSAFLYGVAICGLCFYFMKKLVMKKAGERVKALEYFRVNDFFIFALIAGWGGFILLDSARYPVFSIAALNLALIVSTLYVVQALGIIKFFLTSRGLPVLILPLIIFINLILGPVLIIFTLILLLGTGTLDLWADFRKLNPDKKRKIKE